MQGPGAGPSRHHLGQQHTILTALRCIYIREQSLETNLHRVMPDDDLFVGMSIEQAKEY
jgi:hypothetical protein